MNKPVAWMLVDEINGDYMLERHPSGDYDWIPLYTNPVKELNDAGEPVKNATYWKRQHDNLLMKLNTCAIKVSELEKQLDIRTRELIGASFYEHDYKTLMAKPELTDKDLDKLIKDAEQDGYMEMYIVGLIDGFNRARAILRKAQEK